MIVMGIELPVEDVIGGSDAKRVAEDRRSTMRGRPQLYDLWTEIDRLVVPVLCPVIESNLYSHPPSCGAGLECLARSHWRCSSGRCQTSRGSCCCKATLTYQPQELYRFRATTVPPTTKRDRSFCSGELGTTTPCVRSPCRSPGSRKKAITSQNTICPPRGCS